MLTVSRTLESLSDGDFESCPPSLDALASTWSFDVVGHVELSGDGLAEREFNMDLAKGLLDPNQGDLEPDTLDHERFFEDMLAFARSGETRTYAQEQGFAPLVLKPGFEQWKDGSWHINADAIAAASQQQRSLSSDIDMPHLSQRRRHWRDMGPDEQRALSFGFEAETNGLFDPDALAGHVNAALDRSDGLTGVTFEQLVELLDDPSTDEMNARYYAAHLDAMRDEQITAFQREAEHARECVERHPLPYFRRLRWEDDRPVGALRGDMNGRWLKVTASWRTANEARLADRARREGYQELRSYKPELPPVAEDAQQAFFRRENLRLIPAGTLREHDDTPDGSVVQDRTTEDLIVRVRHLRPDELPSRSWHGVPWFDAAWKAQHYHRIRGLVEAWGLGEPVFMGDPDVDDPEVLEAMLDRHDAAMGVFQDACDDAYYVLRFA